MQTHNIELLKHQNLSPTAAAFLGLTTAEQPSITELYEQGLPLEEIVCKCKTTMFLLRKEIKRLAASGQITKRITKTKSFPLNIRVKATRMRQDGTRLKDVIAYVETETSRTPPGGTVRSWEDTQDVKEELKKQEATS